MNACFISSKQKQNDPCLGLKCNLLLAVCTSLLQVFHIILVHRRKLTQILRRKTESLKQSQVK